MSDIRLWKCDGCGKTKEQVVDPMGEMRYPDGPWPTGDWFRLWNSSKQWDLCPECVKLLGIKVEEPEEKDDG